MRDLALLPIQLAVSVVVIPVALIGLLVAAVIMYFAEKQGAVQPGGLHQDDYMNRCH